MLYKWFFKHFLACWICYTWNFLYCENSVRKTKTWGKENCAIYVNNFISFLNKMILSYSAKMLSCPLGRPRPILLASLGLSMDSKPHNKQCPLLPFHFMWPKNSLVRTDQWKATESSVTWNKSPKSISVEKHTILCAWPLNY